MKSNRSQFLAYSTVLVFIVLVYCWPALRARAELGSALPPEFAPDLTMYVALSTPPVAGMREFQNPYYRVPVADKGSGYLSFHLAPGIFSRLRSAFPGRLWTCMFGWNLLWWALLAGMAICLFRRNLPNPTFGMVTLSAGALMLFNFSALQPLLSAWLHLPSLAGFETIELPFMRAFIPVMPVVLLLAYLALQISSMDVIVWF